MTESRFQAGEVQSHHGRGHHRKTRMLSRHLMNRAVRSLNGQLHQVFSVFAVFEFVKERFSQNIDGSLRSDFSGISAANSIGNQKNAALGVSQERILVHRPLFAQAAIRNRSSSDLVCRRRFTHCTASRSRSLSGSRLTRAIALASFALRWENAINIPNMAKLVIKLNPPWLTNGRVMPVIGSARTMPPIFTSA